MRGHQYMYILRGFPLVQRKCLQKLPLRYFSGPLEASAFFPERPGIHSYEFLRFHQLLCFVCLMFSALHFLYLPSLASIFNESFRNLIALLFGHNRIPVLLCPHLLLYYKSTIMVFFTECLCSTARCPKYLHTFTSFKRSIRYYTS